MTPLISASSAVREFLPHQQTIDNLKKNRERKNETNNEFVFYSRDNLLKREKKFQCHKFLQSFVLPQILQTRQLADGKLARTVP